MKKERKKYYENAGRKYLNLGIIAALAIFTIVVILFSTKKKVTTHADPDGKEVTSEVTKGIHTTTGLKEAEGLNIVITHCTACHSAQIITQNRMSKEKWNATIRWMQDTQNLWDLGDNQEIIVNYLVANYPVENIGRRKNLDQIKWYELKE